MNRLHEESLMLDEIEGTTSRINAQSKAIQNEAKQSIKLLSSVDNDMEMAGSDLRQEALHAQRVSKVRGGMCWMYVVIVVELISLISLILKGLG